MEFRISLEELESYGYVMNNKSVYGHGELTGITSDSITDSKLQSNMNCGSIGVKHININDCERIIKENECIIKRLQCEVAESKMLIEQLESYLEDSEDIQEENCYLRGLLKLYL